MLDQRLLRDNPELISQQLGRRGMEVDLTKLQLIAKQERDLEEQRSNLQAEGNRVGKEVGLKIPLIVRLEGTNVQLGKDIINNSGLDIITAEDLDDAAQKAVASL